MAVLLTLALCWVVRAPLYIRFALSERAMRYAQRLNAVTAPGDIDTERADRVGLYVVTDVDRTPWGMRFGVADSGWVTGSGGWAYPPNGAPPGGEELVSYRRLWGPWYVYERWLD